MNQNESQATERQDLMEALSMCIDALDSDADRKQREFVQANAVRALGGAALKAQPAPTEAQGDGLSPVYAWLERSTRNSPPDVANAARTMMAFYQGAEFPEVQGEDSGRLRELLRAVVQGWPGQYGNRPPGHSHQILGIWDDYNGPKSGTECTWCKTWGEAIAEVELASAPQTQEQS